MRLSLTLFVVATLALARPAPGAQETAIIGLNREYQQAVLATDHAAALQMLRTMAELPEVRADRRLTASVTFNIALTNALLGNCSEAIQALREAVNSGFFGYAQIAADSAFDALRNEPEFKALLASIPQDETFKGRLARRHQRSLWLPLEWNETEPAAEFKLRFDDPGAPELTRLRVESQFESSLAGSNDEYEALIRLAEWTSRQWEHNPSQTASLREPLTILREAKAGGRFLCHDYAVLLAGSARAYGLYARHLMSFPRDVETRSEMHSVAEVWLPKFSKWVVADGQFGIVPELEGVPLNALELQRALAAAAPVVCRGADERCLEWKSLIMPNLFYFKIAQDQRRFAGVPSRQLVLVPKGAAAPHTIAGGHESVFADAIYSSNPASFYAGP